MRIFHRSGLYPHTFSMYAHHAYLFMYYRDPRCYRTRLGYFHNSLSNLARPAKTGFFFLKALLFFVGLAVNVTAASSPSFFPGFPTHMVYARTPSVSLHASYAKPLFFPTPLHKHTATRAVFLSSPRYLSGLSSSALSVLMLHEHSFFLTPQARRHPRRYMEQPEVPVQFLERRPHSC